MSEGCGACPLMGLCLRVHAGPRGELFGGAIVISHTRGRR